MVPILYVISLSLSVAALPALMPHEVVTLSQTTLMSPAETELLEPESCRSVTILWARDVNDLTRTGNNVGPSFFTSLSKKLGGTNRMVILPIDYPNPVGEYHGRKSRNGPHVRHGNHLDVSESTWDEAKLMTAGQRMALLAKKVMDRCPSTHLVLSGHGKGGRVVHDASTYMTADVSEFARAGKSLICFTPSTWSISDQLQLLYLARTV
jgi:hypothetical protein